MAQPAEEKEQSPNRNVQTMKAGGNEKDGTIKVSSSGEFHSIRVFVPLAEKESTAKQNR